MLNAANIPSGGNTNKFAVLDAGSYPARLARIVDIGVQPQFAYKGQSKPPVRKLQLTYELLDEFALDEEGNELPDDPRWVWETFPLYGLKSDRAKSTIRYMSLDPAMDFGGDWAKLATTPCTVTLAKEAWRDDPTKFSNRVTAVSSMRAKDADKAPSLVKGSVVFDMDEPDLDVFNSLPQNTQDLIKKALNYPGSAIQALVEAEGGAKPEEMGIVGAEPEDDNDSKDW